MSKKLIREEIFVRLKRELPYLQARYGADRIALYGSFVRDMQTEKSDVAHLDELSRRWDLSL